MQAFYPTMELKGFFCLVFNHALFFFFGWPVQKGIYGDRPYKFIFQSSGKQYGFIFYISKTKCQQVFFHIRIMIKHMVYS